MFCFMINWLYYHHHCMNYYFASKFRIIDYTGYFNRQSKNQAILQWRMLTGEFIVKTSRAMSVARDFRLMDSYNYIWGITGLIKQSENFDAKCVREVLRNQLISLGIYCPTVIKNSKFTVIYNLLSCSQNNFVLNVWGIYPYPFVML